VIVFTRFPIDVCSGTRFIGGGVGVWEMVYCCALLL